MLKPVFENLIVKVKKFEEEVSPTGIVLTVDKHSKTYSEGYVVAVGEGYLKDGKLFPLRSKVGDMIIFRKLTGISINVDGEEYEIVSEQNVLAINSIEEVVEEKEEV